jgi:hypothetical protein
MTTPISLSALSGVTNGTVIYAYYNASINFFNANNLVFYFRNAPSTTLRDIYIKKSGFYMAIFLPSNIRARACSIVFYYNNTNNLACGQGESFTSIYGNYMQLAGELLQCGQGIPGFAGLNGNVSASLYIIRILTIDIPSSLLPDTGNGSIPNGSGGRISTTNSEYRNPDQ